MKRLLEIALGIFLPLVLCVCTLLISFTSIEKEENVPIVKDELTLAFENLENGNYTARITTVADVTFSVKEESYTESVSSIIKVQVDPTQTYSVTFTDGNSITQYTKIEDDQVNLYLKSGTKWEQVLSTPIEEYSDEYMGLVEITPNDIFEKVDGVYVGDTEAINEQLDELINKYVDELAGSGLSMSNAEFTKYNVVLENGNVSRIDVVLVIEMGNYNGSISLEMAMTMRVSKIGETIIEAPTKLPEVSE